MLPQGFVSFFPLAFQSLDRDSPLPGVLIITSSVPSYGLLMESCALGFLQKFSVCCSQESRKSSHNWYWNKNNKALGFSWAAGRLGGAADSWFIHPEETTCVGLLFILMRRDENSCSGECDVLCITFKSYFLCKLYNYLSRWFLFPFEQ